MKLRDYHRFLFQWHCRKFFRFRRHLTELEKAYLERCFELAEDFVETSDSGYEHFSYYSYSHRVEGEKVNSSRLAYGSVKHPGEAWEAAVPVLEERGLRRDLDPSLFPFYGLGWDIEEEQFKLYWRALDLERLPEDLRHLTTGSDLSAHRPEGLISLTFTRNLLSESKVYLYPKAAENLPEGVRGEARMLTSQRGEVPQYDLTGGARWDERLNEVGQRIVAAYRELDEELDTIAWQGPNCYTLYFP